MTHDETMDGLARRIAELKPDWAMVGMTMTDREMGVIWHRTVLSNSDVDRWYSEHVFDTKSQSRESFARAQPNGPEWRHAVTALGLLALVPEAVMLNREDRPAQRWGVCDKATVAIGMGATREEAILRAVVAHLEAK